MSNPNRTVSISLVKNSPTVVGVGIFFPEMKFP